MRTRIIDDYRYFATSDQWFTFADGHAPPFSAVSATHLHSAKHNIMVDEPHPNYKARIKNGELIIGDLSKIELEYDVGGGGASGFSILNDSWVYRGPSVTSFSAVAFGTGSAGNIGDKLPMTISIPGLKLQALAAVDAGQYNFTEDILEWRKNLSSFRTAFSDIGQMFTDMKNKSAKGKFKTAADAWTFFRFGATPSFRMVHDLYESLSTPSKTVQPFVRLRSGAIATENLNDESLGTSIDGLGATHTHKRVRSAEYKATVGVYYKVTKIRNSLAYKYSTRFKDLPVGFWNTIPLSFMFDRVYNVSRLTKAAIALSDPEIIIEGGYVTVKSVHRNTLQLQSVSQVPNWTTTWSGDTVTHKEKTINRSKWNPSSSDLLNQSVDLSGLTSDATKTADLAALTIQRLEYFKRSK